ncbi:hypothetical protein Q8F55_004059 [Vanrija albida]|uniref:Uncharacterized protein n=1 Tax=Vanrija albida TaxID=181172 RepID=A0ABR3Q6B2_9TREE
MPDERTPLVGGSTSVASGYATPAVAQPPAVGPDTPLQERAAQLLASGGGDSASLPSIDLTHELASALYALHVVERHDRARGSARAAASRASATARQRAALRDHALAVLDQALHGEQPDENKDDDEDVLDLNFGLIIEPGNWTTVAALLSHHTTPGAVLAHPLIRAALPRAWSRPRRTTGRGLRVILQNAVTPARAHVLELVASLVFVALTLVTALVPDVDVRPDTSGPTTIVWSVWAWASFLASIFDTAHNRRGPSSSSRIVLLLPAQLAGILHPIPFTEGIAVALRTLAIPFSTLAVVLPAAPALPLLFPARLLPLATILAGILARGARAAALLIPLAAGLWALFAYALNGDVWRAGSVSVNVTTGPGGPVEVGVAPFETRVALFITLVLVIGLSAGLSILRALAPSNELHDGTWEAEYGPDIGHASRRALAAAVARYLPPSRDSAPPAPPLPIPFNLLMVPLDVAAGVWRVIRGEPPFHIRRARGWLALIIVATPCLVLAPLSHLLPYW